MKQRQIDERNLLQYSYEANRSATHHRGLHGDYGYERILGFDLVRRCMALMDRSDRTIRVLDIGCGDGLAVHQLDEEIHRRMPGARAEFFGLGINRYPRMYIDSEHFIRSGINQLVHEGLRFDLIVSVFTWHYIWHKIEALEKVQNHLLSDGGEAHIHFPGYLVQIDDDVLVEDHIGNDRFGLTVKSLSMREKDTQVDFRIVPYTSDDDDGTDLGSFGVLSMTKSDAWIDWGLIYDGCDLVRHGSGSVYVSSRYVKRKTLWGRANLDKRTLQRTLTTSTEHVKHYPFYISLDVCVHSQFAPYVIITYPGAGRDVDGIGGRYKTLASEIQDRQLAAVVRLNNPYLAKVDYPSMLVENLRYVIDYVLENAEGICGNLTPELYLMGHSAGASAIGAIASEYEQITKLLLLSPSLDVGKEQIRQGLAGYTGELHIVVGMDDRVVLPVQSRFFARAARNAGVRRFVALWHCDHDFSGPRNNDLLRKAPHWAFFGSDDFPEDLDPHDPLDPGHD